MQNSYLKHSAIFFHRARKKEEREEWLQMLTKHAQSEKVLDPRHPILEP